MKHSTERGRLASAPVLAACLPIFGIFLGYSGIYIYLPIVGIFLRYSGIYLPAHRGETSELLHLFSQPLARVRILRRFNFLTIFRTGLSSPGLRKWELHRQADHCPPFVPLSTPPPLFSSPPALSWDGCTCRGWCRGHIFQNKEVPKPVRLIYGDVTVLETLLSSQPTALLKRKLIVNGKTCQKVQVVRQFWVNKLVHLDPKLCSLLFICLLCVILIPSGRK